MPEFEVTPDRSGFLGYNSLDGMNIQWQEKNISLKEINSDGSIRGINSRPIRDGHINKLKANYTGDTPNPKVMWHSIDEFYYIIDGQHMFNAWLSNINEGKIDRPESIRCSVIQDLSGRTMDGNIDEDRDTAYMYSFRMNDGTERNCISDIIGMVMVLADKYIRENKKVKGIIEYITEKQASNKKLSKETIYKYHSIGKKLKALNLLEEAQLKRLTMIEIEALIARYKLVDDKKKVSMRLYIPDADKFKEQKFDDFKFWQKLLREDITPKMILEKFKI
ncbi:MAG: hypothetical protein OIN87_04640 [Candidatus Methanoperedens sp.]|nr:hypothetical protein [Candidatus Methanoperedens sp.]